MSRRNRTILMDHLSGETLQSIADRMGLHQSRIHQIVNAEKSQIGWEPGMSKSLAGARCVRAWPKPHSVEAFYREVENEKTRDRRAKWPLGDPFRAVDCDEFI